MGASAGSTGQLESLSDLGIVELDLGSTTGSTVQNGNLLGLEGHYVTQDGSQHALTDVWFGHTTATAAGSTASSPLPTLSELLQPATGTLLGAGTADLSQPTAHDASVHNSLNSALLDQRLREHDQQQRQAGNAWW